MSDVGIGEHVNHCPGRLSHGKRFEILRWCDDTRAAERGEDLASVVKTLTNAQLKKWERIFRRNLGADHNTFVAEMERRRLSRHDRDLPGQLSLF